MWLLMDNTPDLDLRSHKQRRIKSYNERRIKSHNEGASSLIMIELSRHLLPSHFRVTCDHRTLVRHTTGL